MSKDDTETSDENNHNQMGDLFGMFALPICSGFYNHVLSLSPLWPILFSRRHLGKFLTMVLRLKFGSFA